LPTKAEGAEKKKNTKKKTKFKSRKHENPNQSLVGTMRSLNDIVGNPKAKTFVTRFMKDALPGSVMVLHGPTGIGKSVLVQTAAKLNRVFLHTLRSMEKDNTSLIKRLKEYMLTPKTYLKECFFIDPFEEISADAATTRSFCELLTSDRGRKSGRCFVIVVNDQWHKAYYPLRTGKMAKLAKNVAMYKLSNAEIRGIINRNNVNGYNSKVISCGVKAADGDGRKAVTFAKDRVLGEGIADRKIDVFKAASAVFARDVKTAMTCPERDRLHDFVRTNLSQFMPHYMVHSKPDQLKLLEQYSDYYDSLARFDVEGFSPDVPLHFAAAASAGKAYKKMEMPVETFKKRMQMREIRRMDCHIFSSVDANTVMRIISSEDSFWCSECNRGLTEGTTFFCPKAKVAMDDYRRSMSERLEGTGVSAKALADALLRFDMRKFMDDVGSVRNFQYK
jgi:hypothetical protein